MSVWMPGHCFSPSRNASGCCSFFLAMPASSANAGMHVCVQCVYACHDKDQGGKWKLVIENQECSQVCEALRSKRTWLMLNPLTSKSETIQAL